jgi:hypothetical protein
MRHEFLNTGKKKNKNLYGREINKLEKG